MNEPLRPYAGLRVLDAGQGVAGPYCGLLLAACGADVVKLEPPEGDWSRGLTTRQGTQSAMCATYNRGKRSVVLDLRDPGGRAAAARLAAGAAVLIESFRPGVAARLGLGPDATGSDSVCVSISGFGQVGPYAGRACTDSVSQAYGGMMALNEGADGMPHKVGALVSDVVTGVHAFAAVQAALAERALDAAAGRAPRRRVLDVSLMAGTAALLGLPIAEAGLLGATPAALNVPAGAYQAGDGAWIAVTLVREAEFVALCGVLGQPALPDDPRYATFAARSANRDALLPILRGVFATRPAAEWLARCAAARVMSERVNAPLDWLADPHVVATGAAPVLVQPGLGALPHPVLPGLGDALVPAPGLGEHTAAVLAETATAASP